MHLSSGEPNATETKGLAEPLKNSQTPRCHHLPSGIRTTVVSVVVVVVVVVVVIINAIALLVAKVTKLEAVRLVLQLGSKFLLLRLFWVNHPEVS